MFKCLTGQFPFKDQFGFSQEYNVIALRYNSDLVTNPLFKEVFQKVFCKNTERATLGDILKILEGARKGN